MISMLGFIRRYPISEVHMSALCWEFKEWLLGMHSAFEFGHLHHKGQDLRFLPKKSVKGMIAGTTLDPLEKMLMLGEMLGPYKIQHVTRPWCLQPRSLKSRLSLKEALLGCRAM